MEQRIKTLPAIISQISVLATLVTLSGCAVFIEGEDRIETEGSTAEVSELVTQDQEVFFTSNITEAEGAESDNTVKEERVEEMNNNAKQALSSKSTIQDRTNNSNSSDSTTPATITSNKSTVSSQKQVNKTTSDKKAPITQKKKSVATSVVKPVAKIAMGSVRGQVMLVEEDQNIVSGQSIIHLIPNTPTLTNTAELSEKKVHIIDMKEKTYLPGHLTIRANDTVIFSNSDKIRHNVFSSSGENAFDLGTYGANKKRGVTLKDQGIVKVYCNIHPNMATFVSVRENGFSTVTDKQGKFSFESVPQGSYTLEAWNIRGQASKNVIISASSPKDVDFKISAKKVKKTDHKNKFGKEYKKSDGLFDDEFY